MSFTGAATVAGVCGWPISHSRSPRIHNYWLRQYGIDGVYVPLLIPPARVIDVIRMLPAMGVSGLNVTIPHKEAAYKAMDKVDDCAQRMRAVNTIVLRDGILYGSNTDAFGFLESLYDILPDWRADAGAVVLLGAGGAARSIVYGLLEAGVPEIRIANRTREKSDALRAEFGKLVCPVPWRQRADVISDAAMLVNTTSLGMEGRAPLDLSLDRLPAKALVYDIVYVPLITPLLVEAQARGNPTVDGLGMLLHQARPGFREWYGAEPTVDDALRNHIVAGL
jgi:shikimate dehydrogenase